MPSRRRFLVGTTLGETAALLGASAPTGRFLDELRRELEG